MATPLDSNRHLGEDEIERYSMGAVPEEDAAAYEEHLLVCGPCREQLQEADRFSAAMRSAGGEFAREERERISRPDLKRQWLFPQWAFAGWAFPAWAPTLAAVVVGVLAVDIIWTGATRQTAPAFTVNLQALRGAGDFKAPPRRPLLLRLDLTGVATSPTYRLEMVDRVGTRVWEGTAAAVGSSASVSVPSTNSGTYFIRVYLPSGEILREFGLSVD